MSINNKVFDDGNWNWHYECKKMNHTNVLSDWYYTISFQTDKGGYLNDEEITCQYFDSLKYLKIIKRTEALGFCVENFSEIANIIIPMVKYHKAEVYPIYESLISKRKKKLHNLSNI